MLLIVSFIFCAFCLRHSATFHKQHKHWDDFQCQHWRICILYMRRAAAVAVATKNWNQCLFHLHIFHLCCSNFCFAPTTGDTLSKNSQICLPKRKKKLFSFKLWFLWKCGRCMQQVKIYLRNISQTFYTNI